MTEVVAFIKKHGGIDYATQKMNELRDNAFKILDELNIQSPYKTHLRQLVNFVIDRNV